MDLFNYFLFFLGLSILPVLSFVGYLLHINGKCTRFAFQITKRLGNVERLSLVKLFYNTEWYFFVLADEITPPQATYVLSCFDSEKELKKCKKLVQRILKKTPYYIDDHLDDQYNKSILKEYSGDWLDPDQYEKHYHYFVSR